MTTLKYILSRIHADARGQTYIFALFMSLFLLMVVAIGIEAGRIYSVWHRLANAVDMACVAVIKSEPGSDPIQAARAVGSYNLQQNNISPDVATFDIESIMSGSGHLLGIKVTGKLQNVLPAILRNTLIKFDVKAYSECSVCGNGQINPGEECDDGNKGGGDGCSNLCELEDASLCGNGAIEPGEECDDGNTVDGDECSRFCQREEVCSAPEVCISFSLCEAYGGTVGVYCGGIDSFCCIQGYCGNGVKGAAEECDDGNSLDGDGCSTDCKLEQSPCPPGEVCISFSGCEAYGGTVGSYCEGIDSFCCVQGYCGNGVKGSAEDCDDGNTVNADGCSSTCQLEALQCVCCPTLSANPPGCNSDGGTGSICNGVPNTIVCLTGCADSTAGSPISCSSAICGDGACNMSESCSSCPSDCGPCPGICGDDTCGAGETCGSCPGDCGPCSGVCGNFICEPNETCNSCPGDCGACSSACGNLTCEPSEDCTSCPADCGACP